ncbi:hypothetical protein J4734_21800 [Klebsiella pneumoniae]|uniref:Uncharacterized protein n=1 Tax=Klebsiella pneumoniae TaxID=573 RepID=A0A939NSM3_KLEPN|nr:hypothetical protein [Klebsiella pneumoniae]
MEIGARGATLPHLARPVSDFAPPARWRRWCSTAPRRACRQPAAVRLRAALHIVPQRHRFPGGGGPVMRASLGRRYAMVGPLEAADMTGGDGRDICQHLLPELASGTR